MSTTKEGTLITQIDGERERGISKVWFRRFSKLLYIIDMHVDMTRGGFRPHHLRLVTYQNLDQYCSKSFNDRGSSGLNSDLNSNLTYQKIIPKSASDMNAFERIICVGVEEHVSVST